MADRCDSSNSCDIPCLHITFCCNVDALEPLLQAREFYELVPEVAAQRGMPMMEVSSIM